MADSKKQKALSTMAKLFGTREDGSPDLPPSARIPERLRRFSLEHLFGDVWQGEALALEERSLITCSVLAAMGRERELQAHFRAALHLGIPQEKLEEMITHVAHYAGWPVAVDASRVLNEVTSASGNA